MKVNKRADDLGENPKEAPQGISPSHNRGASLPILRLALEEPRQVDEDGEDDDGRHVLEEPALARLGAVDHRDILFLVYHVIVYY